MDTVHITKNNTGLALIVCEKTLFLKFSTIFPECEFLIGDSPQLHPLICLIGNCHRNMGCMSKLVRRIKFLLDVFPKVELVILYFTYRDRPGSIRAGIFNRTMDEPYLITLNRTAWEKFKELGEIYEFDIPDKFFLDQDIKVVTVNKSLPIIK